MHEGVEVTWERHGIQGALVIKEHDLNHRLKLLLIQTLPQGVQVYPKAQGGGGVTVPGGVERLVEPSLLTDNRLSV